MFINLEKISFISHFKSKIIIIQSAQCAC